MFLPRLPSTDIVFTKRLRRRGRCHEMEGSLEHHDQSSYEQLEECTKRVRRRLHYLMDAAWVSNGRQGPFSGSSVPPPFPVDHAEQMRTAIITSGKACGGPVGSLFASAGRKGYWLKRGFEFRLEIWYIDRSHNFCGDKSAAGFSNMDEACEWIHRAAPHEFKGNIGSAHIRIAYVRHRQFCLNSGIDLPWIMSPRSL